jgi:hypothetical protein
MARRLIAGVAVATLLALWTGGVEAQFGHPFKGQWSGELTSRAQVTRILLNLDWDGKAITGDVNPGPDAAVVKSVTFDYSNVMAWGVKLTAEGKDAGGKPVTLTLDGKLENLGAYRRLFHGTWTQGAQKGEFTVTRN